MNTTRNNAGGVAVVILAAGKGTRMKSEMPKVLHPLAGKPLLSYALDLSSQLDAGRIVVVVGHQAERVKEEFAGYSDLRFVLQHPQLGTGHAVMAAAPELGDWQGPVLILCGDVPGLKAETMRALLRRNQTRTEALTVLAMDLSDPGAYGRLVTDTHENLLRIVEYRDASDDERKISLVNAGIYVAQAAPLLECLPLLQNLNAQKEYYLTDLVELMNARGLKVGYNLCPDPLEVAGVNSVAELKDLEALLSKR